MDFLEANNVIKSRSYNKKPVLPAEATPQVLVDAAEEFDALLAKHGAEGSTGAAMLELFIRRHIDAVLRREVVEPVNIKTPIGFRGTDVKDINELSSMYAYFRSLMRGDDNTRPKYLEFAKRHTIRQRRHMAAEFGVELNLTDDEVWEL